MGAPRESERDVLTFEGEVAAIHRGDLFTVDVTAGALRRTIIAKRAGRLVAAHIRVVPGDRVRVEVTPYDLTRGRITYRL
jgi:translation initiation factor IF-1